MGISLAFKLKLLQKHSFDVVFPTDKPNGVLDSPGY